MKLTPANLILQNGAVFPGLSPFYQKGVFYGEVVFATGMTGYVESLTDPSYNGQILTFTYPLIGNYGVPVPKKWESKKIYARGIIVSEACDAWSHADGKLSLLEWLKEQKIPIITDVDTRALTKLLRESGVMLGAIANEANPHPTLSTAVERGRYRLPSVATEGAGGGFAFPDPNLEPLVAQASVTKPKLYQGEVRPRRIETANENLYGKSHKIFRPVSKKIVIAVDCGMKENIIRCLEELPITIKRVPFDYDYTKEKWDGLFISNGPGDPSTCTRTIEILRKALETKKPIFGICLGSQLLGLAAGAKTYKLPYGHRGHNQPCVDVQSGRAVITSQNHGFAVDEKTLPKDWQVTFRNLNDNSVEGVAHKTLPYFSVQFHPEASPGPTDTKFLFEKFYKLL